MTAYVLCLLVIVTLEQLAGRLRRGRAGILSLLVVLAMPLVDMALCRLLDRRAARAQPDGGPGPAPASCRSCDGASTSWSPPPARWQSSTSGTSIW